MNFKEQVLRQGISDGFRRVGAFPQQQGPDVEEALRRVLEAWPVKVSDQFCRLFAELTTIAATARYMHHEPPLSEDDMRDFLVAAITYLNSFTHE